MHRSPFGRSAVTITHFYPAYLVSSFVRFQWKATEGLKAKTLKVWAVFK